MTMKTTALLGAAWSLTLGAAFWLGQSLTLPGGSDASSHSANGLEVAGDATSSSHGANSGAKRAAAVGAESVTEVRSALDAKVREYLDPAKTPAEKLAAIMEIDDPLLKMSAFLEVVKGLHDNGNFSNAAEALAKNFEPRGRGREMSLLMTAWAQADPRAALDYSTKLGDWQGRYAAYSALGAWVKNDPQAAKAWALEKGKDAKEDEGNWYMLGVVNGLVKSDLDTAVSWAMEQPRSKVRGDMMDRLIEGYFKQRGQDAAQAWALSLPDGPFREGVLRRTAMHLTDQDPASGAAWIETLPTSDSKFGAMSDLMERWANKDPNAAGTWLNKFQGPQTDEPRRSFAWQIREKDPEAAVAWAGTVVDIKQRDRLMVDIVRDWYRRDPKAAQGFMQTNAWPSESQQRVVGGKNG